MQGPLSRGSHNVLRARQALQHEHQRRPDFSLANDSVEGLCHAYKVGKDDVFFFAEFRDNSNSERKRQEQWPKIIKSAVSGAAIASSSGKVGPRKPQPNFFPIVLSEEQVLVNTLKQLASALSLQPDEDRNQAIKFATEAAKQCLLRIEPDLQHLQHGEFDDAFENLLNIQYISMDHSLARDVVTKAETMWKLAIDADLVERVGQAMREARLVVSIQLLRPFILIATDRMKRDMQMGVKTSSDEEIVRKAYQLAQDCTGILCPRAAIDETPILGALQSFHQNMEYLTKKLKANEEDAKNAFLGHDNSRTASMKDVMSICSETLDHDEINRAVALAARVVHEDVLTRNEKVYELIDQSLKLPAELLQGAKRSALLK